MNVIMNNKKKIYGKIIVVNEEVKENEVEIEYFYPIHEEKIAKAIQQTSLTWMNIPRENFDDEDYKLHPSWKEATVLYMYEKDIPIIVSKNRGVATCAFSATKQYINVMLGGNLTNEDENWYKLNSLVTNDGLPQENSFTVIQQLVQPYNIGICEIVVPKHSRRFDSYTPFITSLGCNPFYLVDGCTTNEEALEKLFPNKEDANKHRDLMFSKWKFHCSERPLDGSIYMRQFSFKSQGHNGGSTFRAPRCKDFDPNWWMSIKLDRLNSINYIQPINIPKYKEWEGEERICIENIRDVDGKTLKEIMNTKNTIIKTIDTRINNFIDLPSAYPSKCTTCNNDPGALYYGSKKICTFCGTEQKMISEEKTEIKNSDIKQDDFLENFYKNTMGLFDD